MFKKYTVISIGIITSFTIILSPILILQIFSKYMKSIEIIQIMAIAVVPARLSLIFTSELLGNENSKSVTMSSLFSIVALSTVFCC
jgi:hypothetical protein